MIFTLYHFILITEGPPTWQIKPYNVTLYSGQKYTLPCRTHGYPAAFHTWTKDGSLVPGHGVTAGINDLLFSEAKISHSGMYTCTAYNVYGHISQTVYVKVFSGMVFWLWYPWRGGGLGEGLVGVKMYRK